MTDKLLTQAEVCERLGMAKSTLKRGVTTGVLPRPLRIGRRLLRWPESRIEGWLQQKQREASRQDALAGVDSGE